jgi:exodeoxyribonuclease-5
MLSDVMEHEVPVLAVGDHGQLPPVMDTGELMKNPELRLEKIHRQAEGDPIIKLSQIIRETGRLDRSLCSFRRKFEIDDVLRDAYAGVNPLDVGVLCWTNRMRIWLNEKIRKALGHEGPLPRAGEIVMCLKNDPPIYNGMRGVLQTDAVVGSNPWLIDSEIAFPEEGVVTDYVSMSGVSFNRERTFQTLEDLQRAIVAAGYIPEEWIALKKDEIVKEIVERNAAPGSPGMDPKMIGVSTEEATWRACTSKVKSFSSAGHPYDFGYAMTVHKSQGSQFKHAIFFLDRQEKPLEEDWRRFAYTAVTRASERLTVIA